MTFDRYQQGDSFLHRLDPRVKVVVTLAFLLTVALLPTTAWPAYAIAWLALVLLAWRAGLSYLLLFRRALLALPFMLAAVAVLFTTPGAPLWQGALFGRVLTLSDAGLVRFTAILLRSWLSVQAAVLLTATTAMPDLLHALRHLRAPALLIAIIGFMYRYLYILTDEAGRLLRARAARSAAPAASAAAARGSGSLWWRARVAGTMVGQLFVRSVERSERVYQAMLARGYRGQLLTMNPHLMQRHDWTALAFSLAALALLILFSRL